MEHGAPNPCLPVQISNGEELPRASAKGQFLIYLLPIYSLGASAYWEDSPLELAPAGGAELHMARWSRRTDSVVLLFHSYLLTCKRSLTFANGELLLELLVLVW